jgi:soluble lytic murein transglycosylase-like protein
MLASRERTHAAAAVDAKPLALVAPSRKKSGARSRRGPRSAETAGIPLLVGLFLVSSGLGAWSLLWLRSLDRALDDVRAHLESRIQRLDAGIHFDSRRQQQLLGIRDEIMGANKRLPADVAYEYARQLVTACDRYPAVDPLLLLAVGIVESGFDPQATSAARARGLYQITPATGRMLARMLGWEYADGMLYDPAKSTELAALYLDVLFSAYNDESLVLAEYNGGPLNAGYLRAGSSRTSAETRGYVAKVIDLRQRLRKKLEQGPKPEQDVARTDASHEVRRLGQVSGIRQAAAIP